LAGKREKGIGKKKYRGGAKVSGGFKEGSPEKRELHVKGVGDSEKRRGGKKKKDDRPIEKDKGTRAVNNNVNE